MFSIARLPRIEFGSGCVARILELVGRYGRRVLVVTGANSYRSLPTVERFLADLRRSSIAWEHLSVSGEPSPALIDEAVLAYKLAGIDVVLGVGGGSALDAAKAIAGLLQGNHSVMDYLEGVGPELPYRGPATPFIAVPTTAGTGSEATRNSVLSVSGTHGFKTSFRDERLVAQYAVVDQDLLASCPREVIAANGMDALTQLMESFVSTRLNPLTDSLAESGMHAVREGLLNWYLGNGDTAAARASMAYAALISGITLAQTGLGSVHGLASPLGAFFPLPHGVVCGTLVAAATDMNITAIRQREPHNPALKKYARVGEILAGERLADERTSRLNLPRLSEYGVSERDVDRILAGSRGSSMKTNPILLEDREIRDIVVRRL